MHYGITITVKSSLVIESHMCYYTQNYMRTWKAATQQDALLTVAYNIPIFQMLLLTYLDS